MNQLVQQEVPSDDSFNWEAPFIGALITDSSLIDEAEVKPEELLYDGHRIILRAIRQMVDRAMPVDVITLAEQLERDGNLVKVGGLPALGELVNCAITPKNAHHYAGIIHRYARDRKLALAGSEIAGVLAARGESGEKLAKADEVMLALQELDQVQRTRGMDAILVGAIEQIETNFQNQGKPPELPFGFADLDDMTCGAHPGDLIIIAGRPSMGKTAFATNIVETLGLKGKKGLVCSLEMTAVQLAMRMISSAGRLDSNKLRKGIIDEDDWARITTATSQLYSLPLWIDETNAATPSDIRAAARRAKRGMDGLDYLVIDYLQLMSGGSKRYDTKTLEIGEISKAMKGIAREMGIPVYLLSQLNRDLEKRTNKRPVMSDLRDSGAIEQDADVILFLYRDEVYNPDSTDKGVAEIIVGKQRNGPTGICRVGFLGDQSRYQDFPQRSGK